MHGFLTSRTTACGPVNRRAENGKDAEMHNKINRLYRMKQRARAEIVRARLLPPCAVKTVGISIACGFLVYNRKLQ